MSPPEGVSSAQGDGNPAHSLAHRLLSQTTTCSYKAKCCPMASKGDPRTRLQHRCLCVVFHKHKSPYSRQQWFAERGVGGWRGRGAGQICEACMLNRLCKEGVSSSCSLQPQHNVTIGDTTENQLLETRILRVTKRLQFPPGHGSNLPTFQDHP